MAVLTARTVRAVCRHDLIYAGLAPFVVIAVFPIYCMAGVLLRRRVRGAAVGDGGDGGARDRANRRRHLLLGLAVAGGLIVGVPIAVLYAVVLDEFIQGLTGVGGR